MTRQINLLIDAIAGGAAVDQLKDKILTLDARKQELERLVASNETPPLRLHPLMAGVYRREIARLHEALTKEKHRKEAIEIFRDLVDKIGLHPQPERAQRTMAIDLHGNLAGIPNVAA